MQTAPRSITSASVSTNGGTRALRLLLILTIRNGSRPVRIVLYQVVLPTSWSCDYANVMEVIAGSWLVLAHCGTNRDGLYVGIIRERTSKTASKRKTGFVRKTSLCVKKSTKLRCSKRSSALLPPCAAYFLACPRSLPPTPRFSSPEKPAPARNSLPAPSTGARGDLRALLSASTVPPFRAI